jgi:hypothetical protein
MPQLNDPEVVAAFRRTMDRLIGVSMRFQRETWRSIQLSEREGRVVKTPDYEDAKRAVMSSDIGAQSASGIQDAEGMLQAAASKSAFNSARGQIYLSADMIERALSGIDGSFCRLSRLFDPEWKDQATEYKYPAAHVAILNDCPLTVEQSQITTDQGITTKMVSLSYGLSAHDRIGVTFTPLRGPWLDPVASLTNACRAALSNMGIPDTHPVVTSWRDHKTALASGSATLSQGLIGAAVRVVEGPEVQGFWGLIAVSSQSQVEAQAHLSALEASVMLK